MHRSTATVALQERRDCLHTAEALVAIAWFLFLSLLNLRAHRALPLGRNASQRPYLKGRIMLGERRSRREDGASCPRCGAAMKDVVTIVPISGEPGLVAYECSNCGYVMSVLVHPQQVYVPRTPSLLIT